MCCLTCGFPVRTVMINPMKSNFWNPKMGDFHGERCKTDKDFLLMAQRNISIVAHTPSTQACPFASILIPISQSCPASIYTRAREIVGFARSGPIFETENRFISQQEAKKSVHKTLYFSRFCNTQTDIVTCPNCSHLIIRCYLS